MTARSKPKDRILVIGLGNPDRGDDGFGPAVLGAMLGQVPDDVTLMTRTGNMLALIDDWAGYQGVICVDAAASMGTPGRVHRVDLAMEELPYDPAPTSGHAFGLPQALALARELGQAPVRMIVYAAEGARFDFGAKLSGPVTAAVEAVATLVLSECARLRG